MVLQLTTFQSISDNLASSLYNSWAMIFPVSVFTGKLQGFFQMTSDIYYYSFYTLLNHVKCAIVFIRRLLAGPTRLLSLLHVYWNGNHQDPHLKHHMAPHLSWCSIPGPKTDLVVLLAIWSETTRSLTSLLLTRTWFETYIYPTTTKRCSLIMHLPGFCCPGYTSGHWLILLVFQSVVPSNLRQDYGPELHALVIFFSPKKSHLHTGITWILSMDRIRNH